MYLLVCLAGYLTILSGHTSYVSQAFLQQGNQQAVFQDHHYDQIRQPQNKAFHPLPYLVSGTSSSHTGHDEKRHRKTLISEAIVVKLLAIQPGFIYCDLNYSLFLPDGSHQQVTGCSFLRGPPSIS
ncbi:hypothetical protein ACX0G9_19450 [Flavitalea flava]